jgi:hypothetical protein
MSRKQPANTENRRRISQWILQESQGQGVTGLIAPNAHKSKEMLERETGLKEAPVDVSESPTITARLTINREQNRA